jgi:hypothetical protein
MNHLSMDRAFATFGADAAGQQRPLSATATDGSLVLVCRTGGFSRPGVGVLRYTAQLSTSRAPPSRLAALRLHINDALAAGTAVRLIIQTLKIGQSSGKTHVRPDLVGKVTGFNGDEYTVDFSRPLPPPSEPRARRR